MTVEKKTTLQAFAKYNKRTNAEVIEYLDLSAPKSSGKWHPHTKLSKATQAALNEWVSQSNLPLAVMVADIVNSATIPVMVAVEEPAAMATANHTFATIDDDWDDFTAEGIKEAGIHNRPRTADEKEQLGKKARARQKRVSKFLTAQLASGRIKSPAQRSTLNAGNAPAKVYANYRAAEVDVFTIKDLRSEMAWITSIETRVTATEIAEDERQTRKEEAVKRKQVKRSLAACLDNTEESIDALSVIALLMTRKSHRGDVLFQHVCNLNDIDKANGKRWESGKFGKVIAKIKKMDRKGAPLGIDEDVVSDALFMDDIPFEEASLLDLDEELKSELECFSHTGSEALKLFNYFRPDGFGSDAVDDAHAAAVAAITSGTGRLDDETPSATNSELAEEGAL